MGKARGLSVRRAGAESQFGALSGHLRSRVLEDRFFAFKGNTGAG
jgi:hypothetical protein